MIAQKLAKFADEDTGNNLAICLEESYFSRFLSMHQGDLEEQCQLPVFIKLLLWTYLDPTQGLLMQSEII